MNNTIIIAVGVFAAATAILVVIGRLATWMWTENEQDDLTDDDE